MERVPRDVFIHHIFIYFDGRTAAMFSKVCKYYRKLIFNDKRLASLIKHHHIQINHPCEFLDTIGGNTVVTCLAFGRELLLPQEGSRNFYNGKYVIEFNDFYWHSGPLEIPKNENITKFLVITYEPLKLERFNLGSGLGTIHRGTSIVLFK
jgi:hypothetical protein